MTENACQPRVLIVDDDSFVRLLVARRIGQLDAEIFEAADGAAAICILRECDVDLVVLDLDMPGVNGLVLLACIRRQANLKHLPVIVLTAKREQDALEAALRAGATSFLLKPLDWCRFGAHIQHVLELGRRARATAWLEEAGHLPSDDPDHYWRVIKPS